VGINNAIMNEIPFVYEIRYSQRAKRLRLVVTAEKVEVVVPKRTAGADIRQFVHEQQDWVCKTLAKVTAQPNQLPKPVDYQEGAKIPYRGELWSLVLKSSRRKRVKISFDQAFIVELPILLPPDAVSDAIKKALTVWLKKQALIIAEQFCEQHSKRFQLYPNSIRVRQQKTRWGSCGIHNDINLNWLLILAPPSVFEYVMVHELCHIRERNHSRQFWNLVAKHLPNYQQQRDWLKAHGAQLMMGL